MRSNQGLVGGRFYGFRRDPNITLEDCQCRIGFVDAVRDVPVPPEIAGYGNSQIFGMVDNLKCVSMECVVLADGIGPRLLAHPEDLALLWMELHLPEVLPASKSI